MLTSPLQHHGLDWIAMLLTFIAIYSLGNKQRRGFVIMMAGNACWIILAFKFQSLGMILANVVFFAMNLRGFMRWRKARPKFTVRQETAPPSNRLIEFARRVGLPTDHDHKTSIGQWPGLTVSDVCQSCLS